MERRHIAVLTVLGAVALAGCAGFAGAGSGAGTADSPTETERTIEVSTAGEATGEPDRATLSVAVQATGTDAQAVRDDLAAADDELRSGLIEWGLDEDQITTQRYDIRETRESRQEEDLEEYAGEHRYEIELHDVDAVGDAIDVAVEHGADSVHRITFGLSEEREAELREDALANAMANADADADVLAANAGLTVEGVYTVSTADASVSPYRASVTDDVAMAERADAATGIETGDVSVSVDVRVVYEAAED